MKHESVLMALPTIFGIALFSIIFCSPVSFEDVVVTIQGETGLFKVEGRISPCSDDGQTEYCTVYANLLDCPDFPCSEDRYSPEIMEADSLGNYTVLFKGNNALHFIHLHVIKIGHPVVDTVFEIKNIEDDTTCSPVANNEHYLKIPPLCLE